MNNIWLQNCAFNDPSYVSIGKNSWVSVFWQHIPSSTRMELMWSKCKKKNRRVFIFIDQFPEVRPFGLELFLSVEFQPIKNHSPPSFDHPWSFDTSFYVPTALLNVTTLIFIWTVKKERRLKLLHILVRYSHIRKLCILYMGILNLNSLIWIRK